MKGLQKCRQENDPDGRLKEVLVNWLTAATNFYHQYNRITLYLDTFNQAPHHKTNMIGQCHHTQLMHMQVIMQSELNGLLLDIDQIDQQSIAQKYEKLVDHTQLLGRLSHQANTLLELTLLSAS